MAISLSQTEIKEPEREAATPPCPRDRLLAALAASPRLNDEDAEHIKRIVQSAREESLADHLSA